MKTKLAILAALLAAQLAQAQIQKVTLRVDGMC